MSRCIKILLKLSFAIHLSTALTFCQSWIWKNPSPIGESIQSLKWNGDIIICSTEDSLLVYSTDRGKTWEFTTSHVIGAIGVDANNNIYSSATLGRVYRTSDFGLHWTKQREENNATPTAAIGFFDSLNGLIVSNKDVIAITTDGGETWSEYNQRLDGIESMQILSSTQAYVFGTYLWFTDDKGLNWIRTPTLPPQYGRILDIFFKNEKNGYIATNAGLFKTIDGGISWEALNTISYLYPRLVFESDMNTGYLTQNVGSVLISKTTDGGHSWTPVMYELPGNIKINDIILVDSVLIASGDGGQIFGVYKGGLFWDYLLRSTGFYYQLSDLHLSADGSGFVRTTDGKLYGTTDDGETWKEETISDTISFKSFSFIDDSYIVAIARNPQMKYVILNSTNNGLTWNKESEIPVKNYSGLGIATPRKISVKKNGDIWIAADYGIVYHSSGSGSQWEIKEIFPDYYANMSNIIVSGEKIWVTQHNMMDYSSDAGNTWRCFDVGGLEYPKSDIYDISFFDERSGYVCIKNDEYGNFILHTDDGGLSWSNIPGIYGTYICTNKNGMGIIYSGGSVTTAFLTKDFGLTWIPFKIPLRISKIFIDHRSRIFAVGAFGRILQYVE